MTSHVNNLMLPLKDSNLNKQYQKLSYYRYTKGQFAERQGFEPQNLLQLPVFKTGAFNHSAIFPF